MLRTSHAASHRAHPFDVQWRRASSARHPGDLARFGARRPARPAPIVGCVVVMGAGPLRVAIVGGGIGGVAAANALLQRRLEVRVYEQAAVLTEVGAGLALQPNGLRMLRRLGFGAEVARWGARWIDPQFRHPDGTLIAPMWSAEAE